MLDGSRSTHEQKNQDSEQERSQALFLCLALVAPLYEVED